MPGTKESSFGTSESTCDNDEESLISILSEPPGCILLVIKVFYDPHLAYLHCDGDHTLLSLFVFSEGAAQELENMLLGHRPGRNVGRASPRVSSEESLTNDSINRLSDIHDGILRIPEMSTSVQHVLKIAKRKKHRCNTWIAGIP